MTASAAAAPIDGGRGAADLEGHVLLDVEARQVREVRIPERAQHPAACGHEIGMVALADDQHRVLRANDDSERVRECAVVGERPHAGQRRETLVDRRAVDAQEAPADLAVERSFDLPSQLRCPAADVDRLNGEDGRLPGRHVPPDGEHEDRQAAEDRAQRGREANEVGQGAAHGQRRGPSGRPPAGGHVGDFAAVPGFPTRAAPVARGTALRARARPRSARVRAVEPRTSVRCSRPRLRRRRSR